MTGTYDEEDKSFKGTKKITWVSCDPATLAEVEIHELDHLITKPKLETYEDGTQDKLDDFVNKRSLVKYVAYTEGCVAKLPQGTHFQFERRGYFFVDKIQLRDQKLIAILVPDGRQSSMSNVKAAVD